MTLKYVIKEIILSNFFFTSNLIFELITKTFGIFLYKNLYTLLHDLHLLYVYIRNFRSRSKVYLILSINI